MKFIVFEGLDGCGKTSVIDGVKTILQNGGSSIDISYEPRTEFGKLAKFGHPDYCTNDSVYFWWLARRYEVDRFTQLSVDYVLKDRYYDTTWVYLELDGDSREIHNFDPKYFVQPDLTIYLDATPEICLQRMGDHNKREKDRFETTDLEKLNKRRKLYHKLIKKHIDDGYNIVSIDTTQNSLNNVIGQCCHHIFSLTENFNRFCPHDWE